MVSMKVEEVQRKVEVGGMAGYPFSWYCYWVVVSALKMGLFEHFKLNFNL